MRSLPGIVSRKAGRAIKRLTHEGVSLHIWLMLFILLNGPIRMRQSVYFPTPSVVMSVTFLQHARRRHAEHMRRALRLLKPQSSLSAVFSLRELPAPHLGMTLISKVEIVFAGLQNDTSGIVRPESEMPATRNTSQSLRSSSTAKLFQR